MWTTKASRRGMGSTQQNPAANDNHGIWLLMNIITKLPWLHEADSFGHTPIDTVTLKVTVAWRVHVVTWCGRGRESMTIS